MDSIESITTEGRKIANKIRIIVACVLIVIVAGAAANNPLIVNISYFVTITIFGVISIINLKMAKTALYSNVLKYGTALFEVSIPTILKVSHLATAKPHMMINEGAAFQGYFLFILLSLFQNDRKLTIATGAFAIIQYMLLVIIGIFVVHVPVISGSAQWAHIVIDDEVGKIVLLIGFTAIAVAVLRNLQYFASAALSNEKNANEKAQRLQKIIVEAQNTNNSLINVVKDQTDISSSLSLVAQDEAAMSEELSSIYEEETASIELINKNAIKQTDETKIMESRINEFLDIQKMVIQTGEQMLDNIARITDFSKKTETSLLEMSGIMDIVTQSGKAMSSFIDVIHDITDQINLLSLNASIEAARAGDYGRGFAVVADEIGKLASATSDNAKEISSKLAMIIKDIQNSIAIVDATKIALNTMIDSINKSESNVNDVKDAIGKQQIAIQDIKEQSSLLNSLSNEILVAIAQQQTSMNESASSIQKLSEVAQVVAEKTSQMNGLTADIKNIAHRLSEVIQL
ncbi:MAG: hypothetical protein KBG92_03825 [Spirochaetes bacterium]|nr:hypothetical protein [Spirochaetota bacterium]